MKKATLIKLIFALLLSAGTAYTLMTHESHLGLDLSGGASLTYKYDFVKDEFTTDSEYKDEGARREKLARSLTTISNRLDPSGGEGVIVHTVANHNIEVQVPAVKGSTPEESLQKTKDKIAEIKRKMSIQGQLSFWFEIDDENDKRPSIKTFMYNGTPVRLEFRFKDGVVSSQGRLDTNENKGWVVDIKFDGPTGNKFYKLTKDASETKRRTAIMLDGKIVTMLSSQQPISGGSCYIYGDYNEITANDMAKTLMSGSLPIQLTLDQEYNVGPTLGKDSIKQSSLVIAVGAIAILIFMAFYYHIAGFIAIIALVLNIALILAIMIHTKLVLTLPGIAGLLLTMGMAVDANILIYERLREELSQGKSLSLAIQESFDRTFVTIFDSNVTTIITGIILFNVGTSALKGFATTLIIGLLVSMFTALFISRIFFDIIAELKLVKTITMLKLFDKPNIPFMSFGKYSLVISAFITIGGLAVLFSKGDKILDVDFKGGISVMIKLEQPLESDVVRKKMAEAGYEAVLIQNIEDNVSFADTKSFSKYNFRFDPEHGKLGKLTSVDEKKEAVQKDLIETFNLNEVSGIVSINNVGPDAAHDLQVKALIAILASMVAILIYIRLRFSEFSFGIGACLALVHDVLIALAFIGYWSLLPTGGRIDLNIVAALLTIVGFSINDTIVIFDRIRENAVAEKAHYEASLRDPTIAYTPKSRAEVFNLAINQTLSRTVWTSATVIFATMALFAYGGPVIHGFAFTMLIGVIAGTYSSIFIASVITVYFLNVGDKRAQAVEANAVVSAKDV